MIEKIKAIVSQMTIEDKADFLVEHYEKIDYPISRICGVNSDEIQLRDRLIRCGEDELNLAINRMLNRLGQLHVTEIYNMYYY